MQKSVILNHKKKNYIEKPKKFGAKISHAQIRDRNPLQVRFLISLIMDWAIAVLGFWYKLKVILSLSISLDLYTDIYFYILISFVFLGSL